MDDDDDRAAGTSTGSASIVSRWMVAVLPLRLLI